MWPWGVTVLSLASVSPSKPLASSSRTSFVHGWFWCMQHARVVNVGWSYYVPSWQNGRLHKFALWIHKFDSSSTGVCLDLQNPFLATRGADEDELKGWHRCGPSLQLGMYRHDDTIEIEHGGRRSTMKILFDRLPMTHSLPTSSKTSFSVEILDFQLVWWCVLVSFALICAWCSLSQNMRLCSKESLVANLSPCLFNGKDWRGHLSLRTTWAKSSSTAPAGSATARYSSEDMNVTECFQGDSYNRS